MFPAENFLALCGVALFGEMNPNVPGREFLNTIWGCTIRAFTLFGGRGLHIPGLHCASSLSICARPARRVSYWTTGTVDPLQKRRGSEWNTVDQKLAKLQERIGVLQMKSMYEMVDDVTVRDRPAKVLFSW